MDASNFNRLAQQLQQLRANLPTKINLPDQSHIQLENLSNILASLHSAIQTNNLSNAIRALSEISKISLQHWQSQINAIQALINTFSLQNTKAFPLSFQEKVGELIVKFLMTIIISPNNEPKPFSEEETDILIQILEQSVPFAYEGILCGTEFVNYTKSSADLIKIMCNQWEYIRNTGDWVKNMVKVCQVKYFLVTI